MASKGVRCPRCNCGMSSVLRTLVREFNWRGKKISSIKRSRECRHCQYRWQSIEMDEELIDREIYRQQEEITEDSPNGRSKGRIILD